MQERIAGRFAIESSSPQGPITPHDRCNMATVSDDIESGLHGGGEVVRQFQSNPAAAPFEVIAGEVHHNTLVV